MTDNQLINNIEQPTAYQLDQAAAKEKRPVQQFCDQFGDDLQANYSFRQGYHATLSDPVSTSSMSLTEFVTDFFLCGASLIES